MTFEKKKLCEILTRDFMVLVFAFTIVIVPLSSQFFVNSADANHRTTSIVSTRNHFWPYGILNSWWHTPTDYVPSDIPNCLQAREIVIHVHV